MSGRIRSIKPEVLEDEVASGLSDAAWRLWVSLWVLADDYGDVRAGEKYLAANVWQDTSRDAATPLVELLDKGRLHPYAVQGQRYVRIHAWDKHQRVTNAGKPRVPTPEEDDGTWDQGLASGFAETRRESPRVAASTGGAPSSPPLARAGARIPAARPPTSDHDPDHRPTTGEFAPAAPSPPSLRSGRSDARGSRLPPDWSPGEDLVAWATERGIDARAPSVLDEFRDHWLGVAGAKGRKADWDATYRNRLRLLLEQGRAPMLPAQEQSAPAPREGDPVQKAEIAALVAEIAGERSVSRAIGGDRAH
jgi:hypothetical protein